MSELKAYTFSAMERTGLADYYLKSEADKVFRRLKARLAHKGISNQRLEADKNNNWRKYCAVMAELRHQKYKRCLAMARWCAACRFAWSFMPDDDEVKDKCKFYEKWKRRWEALAEEPTWAKFLQLIHKEAK